MDTAEKKRLGLPKWLVICLCVIVALAAIVALTVLAVYRGVHLWLDAELGDGLPDASAYVMGDAKAEYVGSPDISLTDEKDYILTISVDGNERKVALFVRDTKAPTAVSADARITIDDKDMDPKDALKDIYDATDVSAEWVTAPKYGKPGVYDTEIKLSDKKGNTDTVKAEVHVLALKESLSYEAGTAHPEAQDFMVVERDDPQFVTDMDELSWSIPGEYEIEISFDGNAYSSTLEIVDTAAPELTVKSVAVKVGGKVAAKDFVVSCADATEVTYSLENEPSSAKLGASQCFVIATDLGGNTARAQAQLLVCDDVVEVEASDKAVTLKDLGSTYSGWKLPEKELIPNKLGAYELVITRGDEKLSLGVSVVDTTPPEAKGKTLDCCTGYPVDAISFVEDVKDISPVTASFETEPDWDKDGKQTVSIILTDTSGNSTTVEATAVIAPDKQAPVIYNAADFTAYVGETPDYLGNIAAIDNADPKPTLSVDSSKVDTGKAGSYEISFTAKDANGNESSKTVKVTLIKMSADASKLVAKLSKIIDDVIEADMTENQKIHAVFDYVLKNVKSSGSSDKSDPRAAVYKALSSGKGDSFAAAELTRLLLDRAGCSAIRVDGSSASWCMVRASHGLYHLDAFSGSESDSGIFMLMDAQLKALGGSYWNRSADICPPSAAVEYR